MLTFFTTAKPFRGHDAVIQRNALKSWKLLHPDVEVILFGDEEGAAETCREFGLRHEPAVERFESRNPYVNFMFSRAQEIARHSYVCYSNCDIILLSDFWKAFEKVRRWRERFLLVARRWDTDVTEELDLGVKEWSGDLRERALHEGLHQIPDYVDFFLFRKGMYSDIPPLTVGYAFWDHWIVWKAASQGAPVVDASSYIVPVHQNHGYNTTPERSKGSRSDRIAERNRALSGNGKHLRSILDANYVLSRYGHIFWTPMHRRMASPRLRNVTQKLVNGTFALRRALGLRRANLDKWFGEGASH